MPIEAAISVKHQLTPHRPSRPTPIRARRIVENDDYAAFSRRILHAHGRRIATGDIEGLTDLAQLADLVEHTLHHAITGLRAAGYSWTDIGTRLGITRQAAHQRFGNHNRASNDRNGDQP